LYSRGTISVLAEVDMRSMCRPGEEAASRY